MRREVTFRRPFTAALITGFAVLMMAANASAVSITYNTEDSTGFGGASLTLNSSSGHAATLEFLTVGDTLITVPSNIAYGFFVITCPDCTPTSASTFDAFTFDLIITDVGSGATGTFVGTSSGGSIFSNSSNISIDWLPLQIGPGTFNATSGDFGLTIYTNEPLTNIVAPNSGTPGNEGVTTVQGFVTVVPEPATLSLIGFALLGLGFWHRRRSTRQ